ncbi:MAG TPA: hypothetical protein VH332_01700, partial [Nitrospira sp.]
NNDQPQEGFLQHGFTIGEIVQAHQCVRMRIKCFIPSPFQCANERANLSQEFAEFAEFAGAGEERQIGGACYRCPGVAIARGVSQ